MFWSITFSFLRHWPSWRWSLLWELQMLLIAWYSWHFLSSLTSLSSFFVEVQSCWYIQCMYPRNDCGLFMRLYFNPSCSWLWRRASLVSLLKPSIHMLLGTCLAIFELEFSQNGTSIMACGMATHIHWQWVHSILIWTKDIKYHRRICTTQGRKSPRVCLIMRGDWRGYCRSRSSSDHPF